MKYNIKNEYINIDNYSPFCNVNEVSQEYRNKMFKIPIVYLNNNIFPIHPDTFNDLKLDKKSILFYIKVYPTASYRTVYYKERNIFIKLSLTRKITRGVRTLPNKELDRASLANNLLKNIHIKHFNYLQEKVVYNKDEKFNYIMRTIPNKNLIPLFTIIKRKKLSKEKMIKLIKRMIDVWLCLASNGLYLEFHTQNILIDNNLNIYYRDLSDVRSPKNNLLPSYDINEQDLMTLSFDKTFCSQNLAHIFRYYNKINKKEICEYITERIKYYNLSFPNYSVMFDKKRSERIPIKVQKTEYRY